MQYGITFSCGHKGIINLVGPNKERERKLKWYKECGECEACKEESYKKKRERERLEAEERKKIGKMSLVPKSEFLPLLDWKEDVPIIWLYITGKDTYAAKDDLKKLGYMYRSPDETNRYVSVNWGKSIPFTEEALSSEFSRLKGIGADIEDADEFAKGVILYATKNYFPQVRAEHRKWLKGKKAIENLKNPEEPEIIKGKRWNRKIYGKKGNESVYLDDVKVNLTDADAHCLEAYVKSMQEYKDEVDAIKNAYDL